MHTGAKGSLVITVRKRRREKKKKKKKKKVEKLKKSGHMRTQDGEYQRVLLYF